MKMISCLVKTKPFIASDQSIWQLVKLILTLLLARGGLGLLRGQTSHPAARWRREPMRILCP